MTRTYCDRCEELITASKYCTGSVAEIPHALKPGCHWRVEAKITASPGLGDWKLCTLCAMEIIREALLTKDDLNPL